MGNLSGQFLTSLRSGSNIQLSTEVHTASGQEGTWKAHSLNHLGKQPIRYNSISKRENVDFHTTDYVEIKYSRSIKRVLLDIQFIIIEVNCLIYRLWVSSFDSIEWSGSVNQSVSSLWTDWGLGSKNYMYLDPKIHIEIYTYINFPLY